MTNSNYLKSNNRFSHLLKKHPCFNGEAHFKYGRIHLPVSPKCNIQCRFCKRSFNKCEDRPGVSRSILSPKKALSIVDKALELCKDITVVGVAGPGDSLATDHALQTFELVHEKYPHLINCLSTNGLKLKEKAKEIVNVGVKTVTVTVNAVRTDILKNICSHIIYDGQSLKGKEAALQLILSQMEGIKEVTKLGAVVKINTVLIPGVNDSHIEEIAKTTADMGASMINVIPLIPQNEMINYRVPSCDELNDARLGVEKFLPAFRHCKQCRADACGIPGANIDLSELLYEQPLQTFSHG
ncbi:radical SAM domain-containing protein [Gottschalkia purinilytica]|uniref:FeMo cofactor biosynthesis protein NifB n=1 Tax=Gottschalkia purinilytica TaxID=1503 RepID=A0A0L0WAY0_GOTPU|nr:radical SAM protein [Gottschalkia purinilytica]KNF08648.1 radical SAM domain-containing protein [Gottschalkia purinilytica]